MTEPEVAVSCVNCGARSLGRMCATCARAFKGSPHFDPPSLRRSTVPDSGFDESWVQAFNEEQRSWDS